LTHRENPVTNFAAFPNSSLYRYTEAADRSEARAARSHRISMNRGHSSPSYGHVNGHGNGAGAHSHGSYHGHDGAFRSAEDAASRGGGYDHHGDGGMMAGGHGHVQGGMMNGVVMGAAMINGGAVHVDSP
jgi:hypothetical protein